MRSWSSWYSDWLLCRACTVLRPSSCRVSHTRGICRVVEQGRLGKAARVGTGAQNPCTGKNGPKVKLWVLGDVWLEQNSCIR